MNSSRRRALVVKAVLVAAMLVGVTAAEAADGVLTRRKVLEQAPAADLTNGDLTLLWTQAPRSRPGKTKVLVRRNGRTRRLNKRGTKGYSGGVDGGMAVYQEINNGDSDLKRFNLRTGNRSGLGVNSRKWEWRPSNSGKWLLFGRDARRDSIHLLNMKNGNSRTLLRMGRRGFATPGQVNGDFAVYEKCVPGSHCSVFRYRISTNRTTKVPHKRAVQYSPSVSATGAVYFMGSGLACGRRVALYRRRNGNTARIEKLGRKMDSGRTYVARRGGGGVSVYFDRGHCPKSGNFFRRSNLNVYRVRG